MPSNRSARGPETRGVERAASAAPAMASEKRNASAVQQRRKLISSSSWTARAAARTSHGAGVSLAADTIDLLHERAERALDLPLRMQREADRTPQQVDLGAAHEPDLAAPQRSRSDVARHDAHTHAGVHEVDDDL